MLAAERRADDAHALVAADDGDADEVGEVARLRCSSSPTTSIPRSSAMAGALTSLTSSSVCAAEDAEQRRRWRAGACRGRRCGPATRPRSRSTSSPAASATASRPSWRHSGTNGPSTSRSSAATAGTLTAVVTTPPVSAATTCSAAWKPARSVASAVEAPRCGVTITFGQPEQRVLGDRLGAEHVERGAADLAGVERGLEVLVDDERAARDVEDRARRPCTWRAPRRRASPRSRASWAGAA